MAVALRSLAMLDHEADRVCGVGEPAVARPEGTAGQGARGEQVHVDEAETAAAEALLVDESQDLVVSRTRQRGERGEQIEDFAAVLEVAAGEFADDEGVAGDVIGVQQFT